MTDATLEITPLNTTVGARVCNVSLQEIPGANLIDEIEHALEKFGVLVFPAQDLSAKQLVEFSRAFASLELTELGNARLPQHDEIFVVGNTGKELVTFSPAEADGELEWHTDHIHRQVPARASLLYALEVPESGGDTLFACMYSAYDALSAQQKIDYETMFIETSASGLERYLERQGHAFEKAQRKYESVWRPLVRRHPLTGRRALYFGNQVSLRIDGWTENATRTFIESLTDHACADEFRYRHQWQKGDAVLWDNRRVLHAGTPYDIHNSRRRMWRTTWREDAPLKQLQSKN
ncbi:MAG: TauD/TfdA family dioxygenase [Pseudomonadota bacterium]